MPTARSIAYSVPSGGAVYAGARPLRIAGTVWTPNRLPSGAVLATDLTQLPVQSTLEIAGSALDTVMESPPLLNTSGGPSAQALTNAWSGAAFVPPLNSLLLRGGGHGDSAVNENEVIGFSLTTMLPWLASPRSTAANMQSWHYTNLALQAGYDNGSSQSSPMADNKPGATHTFNGLTWIPGAQYGNTNGALFVPGSAMGFLNLDTWAYTVTRWNEPPDGSRDWSNMAYIMAGNQLWGMKAVPSTWERCDWTQTEATDWSAIWGAGNSVGTFPRYWTGASGFPNWNALVLKMPERGEIASIGPAASYRARLGEAVIADLANAADASSYLDTITLTSSDGSHTDFGASYTADTGGTPGVTGLMHMAHHWYDHATETIYVWGNLVGGRVYTITGLDTNTWTTTKLAAGTASLTASWGAGHAGHGSYGRCAMWQVGSAKGLIRIDQITTLAQIVRLQ